MTKVNEVNEVNEIKEVEEVRDVKLNTKNTFTLVRIVNKTNLLVDSVDLFMGIDYTGKTEQEIEELEKRLSFDMIVKLLGKLDGVEKDFYTLLADIEGITPKEAEELDLDITIDILMGLFKSKAIKRVFKLAS